MSSLWFVPAEELHRLRRLVGPETTRLQLLAAACRINALYMVARAGSGHLGSSFSSMDLMVCLQGRILQGVHGDLMRTQDVFFSSKGHDAPGRYAVLLAFGLLDFELIHSLRRLGGLPGHPDVSTPFAYTNTGSLGMGLSKAKGIALARRRLGRHGHIFVLTGDGELQEGQFWEALQPTANLGLSEITVLVDHNKLQSDTYVSQVSDLGDLQEKVAAFGWETARLDGHDYPQLLSVLPPQPGASKPRLLIADTIKGKGVSFMEHTAMRPGQDRLYKYHSGAPSPEDYANALDELRGRADELLEQFADGGRLALAAAPRPPAPQADGMQRLVAAYAQALVREGERNPNLVVLDGDLAKDTGLLPFEQRFPDRFYECGIAEQDMVSQAGGMALSGMLPVVHSFACFLSDRPNEQIYNNATERTKIIYVGSLAGLVPAGPGHSHQCVRDLAALRGIPGLVLMEPACEQETRLAVAFAACGTDQSVYLRLVSVPCRVPFQLPAGYRLEEGKGVVLREGSDAVLLSAGPVMLAEAWRAAELLEADGIGLRVVNMPWANRVDRAWLASVVADVTLVITVDNHYVEGGLGQFLLAELARMDGLPAQKRLALGVDAIPVCGNNEEALRAHGLDARSLARRILLAAGENSEGGADQAPAAAICGTHSE